MIGDMIGTVLSIFLLGLALFAFVQGFRVTTKRRWRVLEAGRKASRLAEQPRVIAELEHAELSAEFITWLWNGGELNHPRECRVCNPEYRPLLRTPAPRPSVKPPRPARSERHPCDADHMTHAWTAGGWCSWCGVDQNWHAVDSESLEGFCGEP